MLAWGMPEEYIDAMPYDKFLSWMAFDSLEPIGNHGIDLFVARLSSTIANVNRNKDTAPYSFKDFMFSYFEEPPLSADAIAGIFGGKKMTKEEMKERRVRMRQERKRLKKEKEGTDE